MSGLHRSLAHNTSPTLKQSTVSQNTVSIPVIGEVAAGYDSIANEDWTGETVEIPVSFLRGHGLNELFVLTVKGDSMYPQYQDGDKVIILKQNTVAFSGDVGVVIYEDESATLKRIEYSERESWVRLVPINPTYQPKEIRNESLDHFHILGVPLLLIREYGVYNK